ncbi:hypothetical protein AYX15_07023 [Cryptococcus neoformans]|nr:hypothetical protein AYX15_07023 [Cryptococcus neoformans var. grubii]
MFGQEAVLPIDFTEESILMANWEKIRTPAELLEARMIQIENREADKAVARERATGPRLQIGRFSLSPKLSAGQWPRSSERAQADQSPSYYRNDDGGYDSDDNYRYEKTPEPASDHREQCYWCGSSHSNDCLFADWIARHHKIVGKNLYRYSHPDGAWRKVTGVHNGKSLGPEQAWMRFELVEAQEHPELVRYRYWYAHRDSSQEAVRKAKAWAAEYRKKPMIH